MNNLYDKVLGVLYGQCCGDAFGTRYEFLSQQQATNKINDDINLNKDNFVNILGGGIFNLNKGMITDDSELAFCLINSIIDNNGYNKYKIAEKYIKWIHSNPFDYGKATSNAFKNANTYDHIIQNSIKNNKKSLSNGCLMRSSSLGILGLYLNEQALKK